MATAKSRRRRPTKRIYYGPPGKEMSLYWTIPASPAKRSVTINGDVMHALKAIEGVTIGCGLSNAALDNAKAFPHRIYLAAFTKSTAIVVDRLKKDGSPAHAVVYRHGYRHITDANDDRVLRRMVKENPSIMQREFTLRVPRKKRPSGKTAGQTPHEHRGKTDHAKAFVPRGALARAVRAGRMSPQVARQITEVASRT